MKRDLRRGLVPIGTLGRGEKAPFTLAVALLCAGIVSLLTFSGVAAQGKDAPGDTDTLFTEPSSIQGLPRQKVPQRYPRLDSILNGLVDDYEVRQLSAEAAASRAPVHRASSVAVTIYVRENVAGIRSLLESNGAAPRNVGADYIEAYVPVTLLGRLSEQPGVRRVRTIIPPRRDQTPPDPCVESLGSLSGTVTRSGSWDGTCASANDPVGYYARYYSFTVSQNAQVTIDLTSPDVNTYLRLLHGGKSGTIITVDNDGGIDSNSRIRIGLTPGSPARTYTVEVSTWAAAATGSFTLTIASTGPVPALAEMHGVPAWQQAGFTGRSIKVGILDDFAGFSSLMGTELPATVVARCYTDMGLAPDPADLSACEHSSDHGTAVAEAIIDLAPDAVLYLSNPQLRADVPDAVAWMIAQGVDIINHSISYLWDGPGDGTSPFRDSPLRVVDRAVAGDILWANAAGNGADETWFGAYADADSNGLLEFGPNDETNRVGLVAGVPFVAQLRWDDRWSGASRDLDLYLIYDSNNDGDLDISEIVAGSNSEQSGEGDHHAYEVFIYVPIITGFYYLMVEHFSGAAPSWIQLNDFYGTAHAMEHVTLRGSIGNPAESANPGLLAIGAAPWWSTAEIEPFSSRGPTPDGRIKPDLVGADGGDSATYGPAGLYGTSQAAPHVAGLAALVLQAFPGATPAQVAQYLQDHAQQRTEPSPENTAPNNIWGHGFARLPLPPVALGSTLTAELRAPTPLMTETTARMTVATMTTTDTLAFAPGDELTFMPTATTTGASVNLTITQPVVERLEITANATTTVTRFDAQNTATSTLAFLPADRLAVTLPAGVDRAALTFEGGRSNVSETFTLTVPVPPDTPIINSVTPGNKTLAVAWSAPLSDGGRPITAYDVRYRRTGTATWTELAAATTGARQHTITNLTNGRRYEVQVRAVNSIGRSAWSATRTGTPVAPPSPPPPPPRSPIIGATPAATAVELAGDLLVIRRHDQPGVEVEVGIGWISRDGQTLIAIGFVRDATLGQTYAVVRREGDGQVVRRWIAPDSPLVYAVPWAIVNSQYTFPVGVIAAIPLDDQHPAPSMLARRFDGGDDRIFAYDAGLAQWRHVPDIATFQALGGYWCDVTAADAAFFERIVVGPPYPASGVPVRSDYPNCRT